MESNKKVIFGPPSRQKASPMGEHSLTVLSCVTPLSTSNLGLFPTKRSSASHDLFLELDQLRKQLRDSKERELALPAELWQCRENPRVSELEKELGSRKGEINRLARLNTSLEAEKTNLSTLSEQLSALSFVVEQREENVRLDGHGNP
jgi:uncharacterized protein (DUF3084 family)